MDSRRTVEVIKLVTRPRTALFEQYRNQYNSRRTAGGRFRDETSLEMEPVTEPAWLRVSREVEDTMDDIQKQLVVLKNLMKEAALSAPFGDDDGYDTKQSEIESQAGRISDLFRSSQNRIREFKPSENSSDEENKLRQNAKIALATRLQQLSTEFRKAQSSYLNQLQGTKTRVGGLGNFGGQSGFDDDKPDDDDFVDHGFSAEQEQELNNNLAIVDEREREIAKIARSIADLAMIFREMQTMIIDQGTILDQIEHNMEMVVEHTKEAHKEIVESDKMQKSYRNKLCVLFLIILVIALVIGLSFKPRS